MKFIYTLSLLVFTQLGSMKGQVAQTHQPPPINNFPFSRGMVVDCMNEIVDDFKSGNSLMKYPNLKDYIRQNYITYLALADLDHGKVIGNSSLEPSLKRLISDLRINFPLLKIALIGKQDGYITATSRMKATEFFNCACRSLSNIYTLAQLDSIINSVNNSEDLQRSETIKFFLRSLKLSSSGSNSCSQTNRSLFDVLYFDDPYWKDAGSLGFQTINRKFKSYCSTLLFLQLLKCNSNDYTVESEFQPTDLFWMNGWTITDQIEQADRLIDRMMIPFFTDPYNSINAFNINCRLLHLLSDRFSKNGTNFFIGFSAESNTYNFCNSPMIPSDYLGKYLSGSVVPSGNMYSVENQFLTKLNDPNYICPSCSCTPFDENQYSSNSLASNFCSGSLWQSYSMLQGHQLFRQQQINDDDPLKITSIENELQMALSSDEKFTYQIIGLDGKILKTSNEKATAHSTSIGDLDEGLYVLSIVSEGKTISRVIPVLHK